MSQSTIQSTESVIDVKPGTLIQRNWRQKAFAKDPIGYKTKERITNRKKYMNNQERYKKESLEYYHKNSDAINKKRRKKSK